MEANNLRFDKQLLTGDFLTLNRIENLSFWLLITNASASQAVIDRSDLRGQHQNLLLWFGPFLLRTFNPSHWKYLCAMKRRK